MHMPNGSDRRSRARTAGFLASSLVAAQGASCVTLDEWCWWRGRRPWSYSVWIALGVLSAADRRNGSVIELAFFAGLSVEKIAEVLHASADTVKRDCRRAKLWMLRELEGNAR